MVKVVALFFLMVATHIGAAQIGVRVDERTLGVGRPVRGTITIAHEENEQVDVDSFSLGGNPLSVAPVGESRSTSISIINGQRSIQDTITNIYQFQAPPHAEGSHTLPPITVVVGGQQLSTGPAKLQVEQGQSSELLELRPIATVPSVIYPGQRISLGYQVHFRDQIELSDQSLPLLEPAGFKPIGERQSRSYRNGRSWVEEVTQEVEATEAGRYVVPASSIEGFRFQQGWFGRKSYQNPRLRAEMKPVTIEIAPLPHPEPEGFTGALGEFSIEMNLVSNDEVAVGDKILLAITLRGEGEWHTVSPPELKKQGDIFRNFRLSDLPPEVRQQPGEVRYLYELRPLSDKVTEIPSVHFASFSPTNKSYKKLATGPIPIKVASAAQLSTQKTLTPIEVKPSAAATEMREASSLALQPQWRMPLTMSTPFTFATVLWAILCSTMLLVIQLGVREALRQYGTRTLTWQERLRAALDDNEPLAAVERELMRLPDGRVPEALLVRISEVRYSEGANQDNGVLNDIRGWLNEME